MCGLGNVRSYKNVMSVVPGPATCVSNSPVNNST